MHLCDAMHSLTAAHPSKRGMWSESTQRFGSFGRLLTDFVIHLSFRDLTLNGSKILPDLFLESLYLLDPCSPWPFLPSSTFHLYIHLDISTRQSTRMMSTTQDGYGSPALNGGGSSSENTTPVAPDSPAAESSQSQSKRQAAPSIARVELKPVGIVNESNTCFLNSTFQAVSSLYVPLSSIPADNVCISLALLAKRNRTPGLASHFLPKFPLTATLHWLSTSSDPLSYPDPILATRNIRTTIIQPPPRHSSFHNSPEPLMEAERCRRRDDGCGRIIPGEKYVIEKLTPGNVEEIRSV